MSESGFTEAERHSQRMFRNQLRVILRRVRNKLCLSRMNPADSPPQCLVPGPQMDWDHARYPGHPDCPEWSGLVWHDWLDEQTIRSAFRRSPLRCSNLAPMPRQRTGREARRGGQSHQPSRKKGAVQVTLTKPLPAAADSHLRGSGSTRGLPNQSSARLPRRSAECHPCPSRQPDGSRSGTKDRRSYRSGNAALVVDRPVAVVAAQGQRPPRIALEAQA